MDDSRSLQNEFNAWDGLSDEAQKRVDELIEKYVDMDMWGALARHNGMRAPEKLNEWRAQLLEFDGDADFKRFSWSSYPCPQCAGDTLVDDWPPNYGGDSSSYVVGGLHSPGREWGSEKCVCVPCKIAFRVGWEGEIPAERHTSETAPLVERDGKLLTPHDVYREEYRRKHGKYPPEAYA